MLNVLPGIVSAQQAEVRIVPQLISAPALTDVQVDGETQTLDWGVWSGAATIKTEYFNDSTIIQTYNDSYGDPFNERPYDYDTEVAKFRFIRVTAYGPTGIAAEPVLSEVRVGEPNYSVSSGFDNSDTPLIQLDLSPQPNYLAIRHTDAAVITTGSALNAKSRNDKVEMDNNYPGGTTFTRTFDGVVSSVRVKGPMRGDTDTGQAYFNTHLSWSTAADGNANNTNRVTMIVANGGSGTVRVYIEIYAVGVKIDSTPIAAYSGLTTDTVFELRREVEDGNVYFRAYTDGTARGPRTLAVTDANVLAGESTIGFTNGQNKAGTYPYDLIHDIEVDVLPANYISMALGTPIQSPDDPSKTRVPITGGTSEAALNIAVLLSSGVVLENWGTSRPITGDIIDEYLDLPLNSGEGFIVYARSTANPTVIASVSGTALVLPTLGLSRIALNEGFVAQWAAADPYEDWCARAEWRGNDWNYIEPRGYYSGGANYRTSADGADGTVKMDVDGTLHKVNSVGLTSYRFVIPSYWTDTGTYACYMGSGLTLTRSSGSNTWSYNSGSGVLTFVVDSTPIDGSLAFDIVVSSIPDVGLKPYGWKMSGSYPGRAKLRSTTAATINSAFSGIRCMTPAKINNADNNEGGRTDTALPIDTPTNLGYGNVAQARMSAIFAAPYAIDTDIEFLWYVTRGIANDNVIRQEMGVLSDLLISTSRTAIAIFSEHGNEWWNSAAGFNRSFHDAKIAGLRRGYAPSGVTTHAAATQETVIDGTPYINYATLLVTGRSFAPGDIVYMNWSANGGYITLDITDDVPDGGTMVLGTNCEIRYNATATTRAGIRWVGRRAKEKWELEDDELAQRGLPRTVHVLSWWYASNFAQIQIALDFDGIKYVVDRVACAPYWGGNAFGTFSNSAWPTASKEKLYADDMEGFLEDFSTAANTEIAGHLANVKNNWVDPCLAYSLAERGDKDAISICYYESGWHIGFVGWPDMCGVYASGTTYAANAFAVGSDGKTYKSIAGGNIGHDPISSPTYWDEYWDATETATFRNSGGLRKVQEMFNYLRSSETLGTIQKNYYLGSAAIGVREMTYFDRIGRLQLPPTNVNSAIGEIVSWAIQGTETDNKIDGTPGTNFLLKALSELKSELAA